MPAKKPTRTGPRFKPESPRRKSGAEGTAATRRAASMTRQGHLTSPNAQYTSSEDKPRGTSTKTENKAILKRFHKIKAAKKKTPTW